MIDGYAQRVLNGLDQWLDPVVECGVDLVLGGELEDADMPERETNVSRGMDSTFAVPAAGSTWTILMVSLR